MEIRTSFSVTRREAAAVLAALVLVGCSPGADADPLSLSRGGDPDAIVFLTRSATSDLSMEALYVGGVTRDDASCLRLESADRHTVVWPHGFRLDVAAGVLRVLDEEGRVVGSIGGGFRLAGGEVPFLHDGLLVSDEEKERAEARCPGRYWVVGEIVEG